MWWTVTIDIKLHINILLIAVLLISCYTDGHILLQCNLCGTFWALPDLFSYSNVC
jgi:hypothetical protein